MMNVPSFSQYLLITYQSPVSEDVAASCATEDDTKTKTTKDQATFSIARTKIFNFYSQKEKGTLELRLL